MHFIHILYTFYLVVSKHTQYTPSLHTWWSVPDSHDHMLLSTEHGTERRQRAYSHWLKILLNTAQALFQSLSFHTSCHVETNHWTLRCFWQRLMKQESWPAGFGSPAHLLSGSVCAWAPGLELTHSTVLFFKPLPHLREHCRIKTNIIFGDWSKTSS